MAVAAAVSSSSSSSKSNNEGRNKTTTDPACRILFQKEEDDDQGAGATNYNSTSSSKKRRDASVHSNTTSAGVSDNSHSISNHTTPSRKRNKIRLVTPSSSSTTPAAPSSSTSVVVANKPPPAKRTLAFGREIDLVQSPPNVTAVYKLVRKLTGSIGGNGCVGPIYGELTQASMQKIVNLMVDVTGFANTSRFLDVGSGIGKPNLHVAQYPGVEFSCGIEMEYSRWLLGMTCLKACLTAAATAATDPAPASSAMAVQGKTMFVFDTITKARTFDPFTHVYMFSIGFPPDLWEKLATMWNRSDSSACHYLICYAGPKHIIEDYNFAVELVAQTTTSMHGSSESHMGYVYRRTPISNNKKKKKKSSRATTTSIVSCDPLFKPSYDLVKSGLTDLKNTVDRQMEKEMGGGEGESRRITTRSQRTTDLSKRY